MSHSYIRDGIESKEFWINFSRIFRIKNRLLNQSYWKIFESKESNYFAFESNRILNWENQIFFKCFKSISKIFESNSNHRVLWLWSICHNGHDNWWWFHNIVPLRVKSQNEKAKIGIWEEKISSFLKQKIEFEKFLNISNFFLSNQTNFQIEIYPIF